VRTGSRVALASSLGLAASLCLGLSSAAAAKNPRPFEWLRPAPAPAGWKHARLPSGDAVLSYPASLTRTQSDSPSVSVAKRDASGRILVFLNATTQQGGENFGNWPQFRIAHNRLVSTGVQRDAAAVGLRFFGAVGSCVTDHYVTRVQGNHYREIACFVQGPTAATVVVAAALESQWKRALPMLERAVSVYRAR
jgi:hypothetical protein